MSDTSLAPEVAEALVTVEAAAIDGLYGSKMAVSRALVLITRELEQRDAAPMTDLVQREEEQT